MKSATLFARRDILCLILVMSIQSTTVAGLRCYECTTDPQAKSKMDGLFSDFIMTTPDCHNNLEKIGLSLCPLGVYYCQVAAAQSGDVSATLRSCVIQPLHADGRHDIGNGVILHYKSCQTDGCNAAPVTNSGVSTAVLFCLAVYTIGY